MTITIHSEAKTGHAMSRHLLITEAGLQERTQPQGDNPGLPLASAFQTNKLNNLVYCLTQLLDSERGQLGLGYLDHYREHGKIILICRL